MRLRHGEYCDGYQAVDFSPIQALKGEGLPSVASSNAFSAAALRVEHIAIANRELAIQPGT